MPLLSGAPSGGEGPMGRACRPPGKAVCSQDLAPSRYAYQAAWHATVVARQTGVYIRTLLAYSDDAIPQQQWSTP